MPVAPNEKPTGLPSEPLAPPNSDCVEPNDELEPKPPNGVAGFAGLSVGAGVVEGDEKREDDPKPTDEEEKSDGGLVSPDLEESPKENRDVAPVLDGGPPKLNMDLLDLSSADADAEPKAKLDLLLSSPKEIVDLVSAAGAKLGFGGLAGLSEDNENGDADEPPAVAVEVETTGGVKAGNAGEFVLVGLAGDDDTADGNGEKEKDGGTDGNFKSATGGGADAEVPFVVFEDTPTVDVAAAGRARSMDARWSLYWLNTCVRSAKGSTASAFLHASMRDTFRPRSCL